MDRTDRFIFFVIGAFLLFSISPLFVGCGDDNGSFSYEKPEKVKPTHTDCLHPNLEMGDGETKITTYPCTWEGHGDCLMFVSPGYSDGGPAFDVVCDFDTEST